MPKINPDFIRDAKNWILANWGEDGEDVINATLDVIPYDASFSDFISYECAACGGDWGAMLQSGIKSVYPEVWEELPINMGKNAFYGLCQTLILCGVDTTK